VRESVCVCVWERERECVCVCERERVSARVIERERCVSVLHHLGIAAENGRDPSADLTLSLSPMISGTFAVEKSPRHHT